MKKKILIVEDDPMILKMMQVILEDYDLSMATDGRDAVNKTLEIKPDIVLMDLSLPVLDGYGAVKEIKNSSLISHIPVIALTASKIPFSQLKEKGFENYQEKPFVPDALIDKIEKTLADK